MSYCLRHKSGRWVRSFRDISHSNSAEVLLVTVENEIKFFKSVEFLYRSFAKSFLENSDIDFNLENCEEFIKHKCKSLKDYEIWYNYYKFSGKSFKICDLDPEKMLFFYIFENLVDKHVVDHALPKISKKQLLKYDRMINFSKLSNREICQLQEHLKEQGISIFPIKNEKLGYDYHFIALISQEDLNLLKLIFEKAKEIKYIHYTKLLIKNYKKYRQILSEIKRNSELLDKELCKITKDILYNPKLKVTNF